MKVVKVSELKLGDHFIYLWDYKNPSPYVYVVYNVMKNRWVESICLQTGKDFAVGRDFEVVPVTVKIGIKFATEEKVLDLTRKCGSCEYASSKDKTKFVNQSSYVRCMNPERRFRDEVSAHRARTTKCCKCYKAKETENAT